MRKEAVYTVLLNAALFKGMKCSYAPQDHRYLRFSAIDGAGAPTHYNLKVSAIFSFGFFLRQIGTDWCLRSLPAQGSLLNCWRRSPNISPKRPWVQRSTLIVTAMYIPTLFSALFSFFLAGSGTTTNVFTCLQRICPVDAVSSDPISRGCAMTLKHNR